jgi:glutamine amidotransferase
MCVIIAGLGNQTPPTWELEDACTYNPDGFGFAVLYEDGTMTTYKSLEASPTVDAFEGAVLGRSVIGWTFHARIATHGAVCVDNCHPFTVGNVSRETSTVITHNGILPVRLPAGYKGSDSSYFAETLLPAWGGVPALNYPETWQLLEEWMGHSKVVILTNDPQAPLPLIILNEVLGTWDGECWYSNTYHRLGYGVKPSNVSRGTFENDEREILDGCMWCKCVEIMAGVCKECWTCQDCAYDVEACRCVPEGVDTWASF